MAEFCVGLFIGVVVMVVLDYLCDVAKKADAYDDMKRKGGEQDATED